MLLVAYTTNDRQVYHGFVYSVDFSSFYRGQILSAVRLRICQPRPNFVKSRQTIRTCKMLVMTKNFSK